MDLGELKEEAESVCSFLSKALNMKVTVTGAGLLVESEELDPSELKRLVNKFIYAHGMNNRYWVALEKNGVRINTFKDVKKKEKQKKETTPPSLIKHGW